MMTYVRQRTRVHQPPACKGNGTW